MQILDPICLGNLQGLVLGLCVRRQNCDEVYKLILSQSFTMKNNDKCNLTQADLYIRR